MNYAISYFGPDGKPTVEGLKLFQSLERRVGSAEAKLAAIAAVVAPTGGATVDAEARAAIVAILGAAA